MLPNYQSYYCYLSEGHRVIVDQEPENFTTMPYHATVNCPNLDIAKLTYEVELRIKNWRNCKELRVQH